MSHLDNGFRSLTLQRFPATDDVNPLQAWEAADEYLLQQLDDTEIRGPVLILNDAFGALSCALAEHKPYSIGDSYISELATRENLRLNGIDESSVKFLDSTADYPQTAGCGADQSAENTGIAGTATACAAQSGHVGYTYYCRCQGP
ncbi:Putative enzyme [Escherichia coli]|nr:Putative enzyme [Escherichia coli]